MIFVITGKNGSGKTYRMVKMVFANWMRGETIYSNTPLYFERYFGKCGITIKSHPKKFLLVEHIVDKIKLLWSKVKKDYTYEIAKRGNIIYFEDIQDLVGAKNAVVLIDEGQALFSSRGWDNLPPIIQWKFQQQRKDGLDLYTTTPNIARIDIIYRELVHEWFQQEKLFAIGSVWIGLFRSRKKDIDQLFRNIDELKVEDIRKRYYWLHFRKPRLYDTNYKIGFKHYKTIWLSTKSKLGRNQITVWSIPKEMTLKQALTSVNSLNYASKRLE